MRPDFPSLKLPRIVSQGLSGEAISSSMPDWKARRVPGSARPARRPLWSGSRPRTPARSGGLPLPPAGWPRWRRGRPPVGPTVDPRMRLGVAFKPEPPHPRAWDRVLWHAADETLTCTTRPLPSGTGSPAASAFVRVASWVSTMPPMLHGAERERPVGSREVQTLGCPCQGMSEIAQLLGAQRESGRAQSGSGAGASSALWPASMPRSRPRRQSRGARADHLRIAGSGRPSPYRAGRCRRRPSPSPPGRPGRQGRSCCR